MWLSRVTNTTSNMSARSRSYSPDSSDFGNSPIKVEVEFRGRPRTPSPSNSLISRSPARAAQDQFFLAVGNLTRNVNEGHLKEIFGVYGRILHVSYPMHPNTGYPVGKAVIEFSDSVALEAAISGMNGGQIDGNTIECSITKHAKPLIRLPREPQEHRDSNRRVFGNTRGRGHRRGGDHYVPMRRDYSRSPIRRRSISRTRSPTRRRNEYSRSPVRRSPVRRFSRSPVRRLSRSPIRRDSRSPVRRTPVKGPSRSPVRRYSRSPVRRYSRSPVRRLSRSPPRRSPGRRSRSRSPVRRFSRSPVRRYSRSPRARGPIRRRSPSYSRSRSPPRRRFTPSPRRFSPRRRSPSRSPVPISRMNY